MAWRQKYTPNVKIRAQRGWCLKYIDDAGKAPRRTANAAIAASVEAKAKRLRLTVPPKNVWVVGYLSLVGQPGHVFFMKYKGDGKYEIRDSETQSGARSVYTSVNSVLSWYGAYSPKYLGWSTHCDGRQYAESYTPKPSPAKPGKKAYYTVKSGDSLSSIAARYKTTWQNIQKLNKLKNPDMIYPGQKLRIK